MHSFNGPSGAMFFHNGDFSGDVQLDAPTFAGDQSFMRDGKVMATVEVPFADLKALVAEYVRRARISAAEDSNSDEVSRLEEMTDDELLGLPATPQPPAEPEPPRRLIKLQPAAFVDNISEEGHVGHRLPYPFYVRDDGYIEGQDFWRGTPLKAMGFQRDLAVQQIDVRWNAAAKEPHGIVGMYLVTIDEDGSMSVHQTAITSVEVMERDGGKTGS